MCGHDCKARNLLLSYPPPHCDLFLNSEVFKCLWGERELAEDLIAYGARGGAKRKQAVDAGLAPTSSVRQDASGVQTV